MAANGFSTIFSWSVIITVCRAERSGFPVFHTAGFSRGRNMIKFCTLASGSSGNSLYLESKYSKILIDAGISFRRISRSLGNMGVAVSDLDAVVLSHEHEDHSRAVGKMSEVPVYVSGETTGFWEGKRNGHRNGNGAAERLREFDSEEPFSINDLTITPFSVEHDAIDPVGFTVTDGSVKIGIVTDIGKPTALVIESLKGCDALVLESNHDREMLFSGSYPPYLQQRISGGHGHLSNEQSASLLREVLHDGLKYVLLAHLSAKNNSPEMALRCSLEVLRQNGAADRVAVSVAPRSTVGEVITV